MTALAVDCGGALPLMPWGGNSGSSAARGWSPWRRSEPALLLVPYPRYGRKKKTNQAADNGHRDEKFDECHPFRVIVICERHAARPFIKMMVRLESQRCPRELHLRG